MVGVGVAESSGGGSGGGGGPGDAYYGEYYSPEQFYVPQEMCPHPQHPQHGHMCTLHNEYVPGGMPVVTSPTMMPQLMPPVMDENMRHYLVAHSPAHPHHQPHHQPQLHQPPHHQPPPHHQQPHHYAPTNGAGGPQHFYGPSYPPHFHHVPPPHHMQHSPPPPVYQKDERTQRQYSKMKQKLERKQISKNNGVDMNSGASTPSLSPRKELNGRNGGSGGVSSGPWSEGEGSSAGASVEGDDDSETQAVLDLLSSTRTPQVSDITPRSALVQWNSPQPEAVNLPNVELTYDLLLGDRDRYKAIYSGPSLSCRVRDLRPGFEYSVRLQVRAGTLIGAASEAATFRAPPASPDAALPPRVAHRARSSLLLRWPSTNDNGARILHYLLEMDAGEGFQEIVRTATRQHTAKNLRPQTRYRFRIAAVNECGRGEWSDETVAWTTGAPPPAPSPPSLTAATPNSLHLAWDRRSDEVFTLQMDDAARGHGFLPVYSGPDLSYVCRELRRATDYRFRLRSETVDGSGPWSVEVTYCTLPEPPSAPGRPTARGKIHTRAFRLRWEPPANDGGAPIESYTLEIDGGEGFIPAYRGIEREAHCDRLRPGAPYVARVRCANVAGDSEWSPTETIVTEAACPGACAAPEPVGELRASSLTVRWRPPDCDGGSPITEYRLELADADDTAKLVYTGLGNECIVRDLIPGSDYRIWVIACNRVGAGPSSSPTKFSTPSAPPEAPELPSVQLESPTTARLEWTAPRDNGAPIQYYRLEMSARNVDEAFSEVYKGRDAQYCITKLTPFTPYFFRVCAVNVAGQSGWSMVRDALTPRAPPGPPAAPRHEPGAHSMRLLWRAPAAHGAEVLRYRVQLADRVFDTEDATPELLLEELAPDTAYPVRVAAFNELGLGEWSEEARLATRPPPPSPPALRCTQVAHNYLKLEWDATGCEATQYCVEMRAPDAKEFRPVYRGVARSCKAKKLREATTYSFRIRANDERGGRGEWSEPLSAQTASAPPPAPRAPHTHPVLPAHPSHPAHPAHSAQPSPRSALVAWEPLDDAQVHYVLQCAKAKDAVYKQVYSGAGCEHQLEELECGGEYLVRVCAVRGGVAGAWSGAARLCVPPAPPPPRPRRVRARALSPRHTALLVAAGFVAVAVLVAVLLQRLVEPRP